MIIHVYRKSVRVLSPTSYESGRSTSRRVALSERSGERKPSGLLINYFRGQIILRDFELNFEQFLAER